MLKWFQHPRKRSTFRGFVAGLLTHYLAVAILLVAFYVVKPFLWTAIFGSPNWRSSGPIDPTSSEGFIVQTVAALSWFPAGAAALHWGGTAGTKGLAAIVAYIGATFAFVLISGASDIPAFEAAPWYWLSAPVGLLSGAAIYRFRARARNLNQPSVPGGRNA